MIYNTDTLTIKLRCYNSENHKEEVTNLACQLGAEVLFKTHHYLVKVINMNNEEVELEVDDGKKVSKHLLQVDKQICRDDEYWYATGNPNDPADKHGPILYMTLTRK